MKSNYRTGIASFPPIPGIASAATRRKDVHGWSKVATASPNMSFNDEQPKSGAARRLSQVEAKVKQGFATIRDVVIGEACNNCAKSTCNKIEHQYFCSVECYHEFNHKREACARGKISK